MSDGLKLLGSIIDTGSVNVLRGLREEYFLNDELPVYEYMRRHYRRYGSVPIIETVEDECNISMPVADESVSYYVKRVEDRYLYSIIRESYGTLKDALRAYDMDTAKDIISDMRRVVRITVSSNDIRTIDEAAATVLDLYEHAHTNPGLSGVPSGLPHLDSLTGGYQSGDLVSYVARPGQGKTYILLSQTRAAWEAGYSVLVVTMEMTIPQIARRFIAMHSGVNPRYIIRGQLSSHATTRLKQCVDNLMGSGRFHIYSGGRRKSPSDVEMLIQEYRPDVVYVDGAHMMNPDNSRYEQRNTRVSYIFDSLNQITIDHSIPVVVTTHLNRAAGSKGKDASLETVAYSDAIGAHSSLVLSVEHGVAPFQKTQRVLRFLKGREGEEGSVHMNFSFSPMDFSQVLAPVPERRGALPVVGEAGGNQDWMLGG